MQRPRGGRWSPKFQIKQISRDFIKFQSIPCSETTDACLVLLFRLPGERGKVSSSRCFDVGILSAAMTGAINKVALSVDHLEEYLLAGIALTALNYFALLIWWIKHWCQNGGDEVDGAAAAPAATPVQPVPVPAFAAPNSPSNTTRSLSLVCFSFLRLNLLNTKAKFVNY